MFAVALTLCHKRLLFSSVASLSSPLYTDLKRKSMKLLSITVAAKLILIQSCFFFFAFKMRTGT